MPLVGICLGGVSSHSLRCASSRLPFIGSVYSAFSDPHRLIGPAAGVLPSVSEHNQLAVIAQQLYKCTNAYKFNYINKGIQEITGQGHNVKKDLSVLCRNKNLAQAVQAKWVQSDADMWDQAMQAVDRGDNVHLAFDDEDMHRIPPEWGDESFAKHSASM